MQCTMFISKHKLFQKCKSIIKKEIINKYLSPPPPLADGDTPNISKFLGS